MEKVFSTLSDVITFLLYFTCFYSQSLPQRRILRGNYRCTSLKLEIDEKRSACVKRGQSKTRDKDEEALVNFIVFERYRQRRRRRSRWLGCRQCLHEFILVHQVFVP